MKKATCVVTLFFVCSQALAKPVVNWLRPKDPAVQQDGNTITGGEQYRIMKFLSAQLEQFEHRFESYPLNRNWFLIKNPSDSEQVHCFFGASFKQERQDWGHYSHPTSIGLPISIVARKGAFDGYLEDDQVSLKSLFSKGFKVVLYDGVKNVWVDTVRRFQHSRRSVVQVSSLDVNLNQHTLHLIEKGRIDFGYVSHKQIAKNDLVNSETFSIYQTKELANQVRRTSRVLCSKTDLGYQFVQSFNAVLDTISKDPDKSHKLRDLNFNAEGYRQAIKASYDKHWNRIFVFAE